MFPNRVGRPTDHNNLYYREFKPLLKNAGLAGEGFTFHSLRHTFATALFKRRQHPKIVQSLLGHASITQTMDTYSHLLEDIGGDAVDGLDEAFSRAIFVGGPRPAVGGGECENGESKTAVQQTSPQRRYTYLC